MSCYVRALHKWMRVCAFTVRVCAFTVHVCVNAVCVRWTCACVCVCIALTDVRMCCVLHHALLLYSIVLTLCITVVSVTALCTPLDAATVVHCSSIVCPLVHAR